MDRKAILVTGGAGYIGSRTCRALHDAGFLPLTYDNLSRGVREFVQWGPFEEGDLLDADRLAAAIRTWRPVACVHFAAFAYVGESVTEPAKYYRNNVMGSLTLAEELLRSGCNKLVFSSTCATYGQPSALPITESTLQNPVNPYGRSKLMVEQILCDLGRVGELKSIALRYFNACGAHEDGLIGEAHDPEPHLIPRAILSALKRVDRLEIFGSDYPTRDGTAIRDYIHISDLAQAHVASVERLLAGAESDCFNLGLGEGFTVLEVVRAVEKVSGRTVPTQFAPRRAGDPAELVADSQKARTILGFNPRYSTIEDMVASAWKWHMRSHPRQNGEAPLLDALSHSRP